MAALIEEYGLIGDTRGAAPVSTSAVKTADLLEHGMAKRSRAWKPSWRGPAVAPEGVDGAES
jgi:hypothetical protein